MTHTRYWAMSVATAVAGAFIAIERFAFAEADAIWITFAVALAATVFSLAAFGVALLRENRAFSGMSALSALAGGFTVIAMRAFNAPTSLWIALAGGVALLLISLRALALHETTVERVTYALEHGLPVATIEGLVPEEAPAPAAPQRGRVAMLARRLEVSAPMRSWTYWLALTGIALAGGFVVLMSFALNVPGTNYDTMRWLTFGIGIATGLMALGALLQHVVVNRRPAAEGEAPGRREAILATGASLAVSLGMIATMAIYSTSTLRWIAFALGAGLAGISLLAQVAHELTSERVRHELEVAAPARTGQPAERVPGVAPSA
jgi:MFS family permease